MEEVALLHSEMEAFHILVNKTQGAQVDRTEAGNAFYFILFIYYYIKLI
jgi:hypothetical protein